MKTILNRVLLCFIILLLAGCSFLRPESSGDNRIIVWSPAEVKIAQIDRQGNIILDLSVQELNEKGYETGDVITVKINNRTFEMPIGVMINEVEADEEICLFENERPGNDIVILALKNGSLSSLAGIAEVELIDEDPGYRVLWRKGIDQPVSVFLNMKEKQGHNDDYPVDEDTYKRTYERDDYPQLNDEEYANFREVETTGMGDDILYRSSSPVNPKLNRNIQSDAACRKVGIKTVMNMADYAKELPKYDNYENTYYKDCNIIALNIDSEFDSKEFQKKLVQGYRYMIDHEGPYLIHCTVGKDRTGFAIGILECLMGAEADEVVSDYMKTFDNLYGMKLGTVAYNNTAAKNIKRDLAKAFGTGSLYEEADLSVCAFNYLNKIGMSEEEIGLLKQRLAGR